MRAVTAPLLLALAVVATALPAFAFPAPTPAKTLLDVCRERIAAGPHKEAVGACMEAAKTDGSPASIGAVVRALMSGAAPPTTDELGMASMMARALHRRAPDTVLGDIADCDIAAKLGDIGGLEACRAELARRAPGHAELARVGAQIEALRTPSRVWFAWAVLGLAFVVAIGHALRRFFEHRPAQPKKGAAILAVVALAHSFSSSARADAPPAPNASSSQASAAPEAVMTSPDERKGLSRWPIDETSPEKSVPTPAQRDKNPLEYGYFLQDLLASAQKAVHAGDHRAAVKYFRAVAKAAPERAVAFTKLCDEYEALGEIDNAISACRMALARPGATPADYDDFLRLAFARPGKLHPQLAMDLEDVVAELRKNPETKAAAERINCELAARTREVKRLEACIATLGKGNEKDPKAVTYRWVLALEQKNWSEAEALVEKARKTSMAPVGVEKMRAATLSAEPFFRRWFGTWQRALPVSAAVLLGLGLLVAIRRSAKNRKAPPTPTNDVAGSGSAQTAT